MIHCVLRMFETVKFVLWSRFSQTLTGSSWPDGAGSHILLISIIMSFRVDGGTWRRRLNFRSLLNGKLYHLYSLLQNAFEVTQKQIFGLR